MTDVATAVRRAVADVLGREVTVRDVRRVAGGTSHETWACDVREGSRLEPVIVRRDVGEGVLDGDGRAEFALLGTLHGLGLPVAQQWLHVEGMTIMERVAGEDVRKAMAAGGVDDPAALGRQIARIQADLHAVDWRATLDGALLARDGGAAGEVEHWAAAIDRCASEPHPLLMAAIGWLRANLPEASELRLVHADFKANNLLLSSNGRVTVLDWELAHASDPHEDLAWTLLWDTAADVAGGLLDRDGYLAAYAEASGRAVDPGALFFWELHARVKLAAIFLMGVRPGATRTPKLVQLARAVPVLEADLADRLGAALERGAA